MVPRGSRAAAYLRADIDYATSEALTTYGLIGVKVWVFKGEILNRQEQAATASDATLDEQRRPRRAPRPVTLPTGRRAW
jgi:small subunit ribosomal protein S3